MYKAVIVSLALAAFPWFAMADDATPASKNLRTDEWGFVWRNDTFKTTTTSTNEEKQVDYEMRSVDPAVTNWYTNVVTTIRRTVYVPFKIPPDPTTNVLIDILRIFDNNVSVITNTNTCVYITTTISTHDKKLFSDSVSTSNTPGNAYCFGGRHIDPVYLAFLDGFDTRSIGTVTDSTNDYDTLSSQVTNDYKTLRFNNYSQLSDRFSRLERLDCHALALSNVLWSSSYIEDAMRTNYILPSVTPFTWTQDLRSKIYRSGSDDPMTMWLPCFRAMDDDSVYKVAPGMRTAGFFWSKILPSISLGDEDVNDLLNIGWTAEDPSVCPFDLVLSTAYGVPQSNIVSTAATARHSLHQIAQADRAISLFDRTLYLNDDTVAYTNYVHGFGHAEFKADASVGPITIYSGADGVEWVEMDDAPGSVTITYGSVTEDHHVSITNYPGSFISPKSRMAPPDVQTGAAFTIDTDPKSSFFKLDGHDMEFNDLAYQLLSEFPSGDCWAKLEAAPAGNGYLVTAYGFNAPYDDVPITTASGWAAVDMFESGTYEVKSGHVSVAADYDFFATTPPRLPFGASQVSAARQFRSRMRQTAFASFIESKGYAGWGSQILFNALYDDNLDPDIADWGYRSDIVQAANDVYVLYTTLPILEAKCGLSEAMNPKTYTGLSASDLGTAVLNFNTNQTALGSAYLKDMYVGGTGDSAMAWDGWFYLMDNGDGTFSCNIGEESVDEIPVGFRTLCISVTIPTSGIDVRKHGKSVDTNVKVATELDWDFPQLTTKP